MEHGVCLRTSLCVLMAVGGVLAAGDSTRAADPPTTATPAKAAAPSMQAFEAEAAKKYAKLTSVLIASKGATIYEHHFNDATPETLHDTRSVTKSITALAVGRAIADGKIEGSKARIIPLFADLARIANLDAAKQGLTLADLLTMSSPLAADDSDQESPGNEDRMHEQANWTRWGLDLPTRKDAARDASGRYPFHYATIHAVLLGQAVQRAVGTPIDAYIKDSLLAPLGITACEFQTSPSGEIMTGGGLRLRSADLLKLGQLVLDGGSAHGRQIIPKAWINECLTLHRADTVGPGIGYGYLFWHIELETGEGRAKTPCWFMAGNGGNAVAIFPTLQGVAVITRADYNAPSTPRETLEILSRHVVPMLEAEKPKP